jgi:two-component system, NtrC family, response regulator HydG
MAQLLLIEDDLTFSRILEGFLSKQGYKILLARKGKEGLETFSQNPVDLVLLDYRLPDGLGTDLLEAMKEQKPEVPVIIMTGFNDIKTAVKAIKMGALDYITKPVNPDELLMRLEEGLKPSVIKEVNVKVMRSRSVTQSDQFIKGNSVSSDQLHKYIELVAPTNMSVIIEGESGTGKEYVARTIHKLSARSQGPFQAVDCGALSKDLAASELFGHLKGSFTGAFQDKMGQFEAASGGTLFLDEVGNLSYTVQVQLLRAIQERVVSPIGSNKPVPVDVRIITATNDSLSDSVKNGSFREDLYHRLNEFKMDVPPLRERRDDIVEFAEHFREQANVELNRATTNFHPEVLAVFQSYAWPGNLREMKNVVKRSVLLTPAGEIHKETLPQEMIQALFATVGESAGTDLKAQQELREKELIIKTLHEVKYNKSKAARLLNIDRKTLYLKLEKYAIDI